MEMRMSLWQRFLAYVGLGPEHQYDDSQYDVYGGQPTIASAATTVGARPQVGVQRTSQPQNYGQRNQRYSTEGQHLQSQQHTTRQYSGVQAQPGTTQYTNSNFGPTSNTTVSSTTREPKVVFPVDFESSQIIADHFKANTPIILNLEGVKPALGRRILDFASGLVYGSDGKIDVIGNKIYLLSYNNASFTDHDLEMYVREVHASGRANTTRSAIYN